MPKYCYGITTPYKAFICWPLCQSKTSLLKHDHNINSFCYNRNGRRKNSFKQSAEILTTLIIDSTTQRNKSDGEDNTSVCKVSHYILYTN